ncbi:MAG: SIR2 family NAD-dependent protein deacylase [Desulfomonilia bacterium]|jgi:NAD-dependent deacetylase|uniref:NAD-dependent protein deacylase 2 n=1 Tax=anaerobic digester metagenome TaxID=1263854 RepID=A0A485LZW8_9ZZZZ|nr:NAD-dependent deacylase [Deltaproteobacteria bacterium]HPD22122.1 NAD-dependent deacylase [Deltaproteobacteria bacterium]HRS56321.1 NAD-dependent deacylase [Desulfomonilia bacterium]HRV36019.1 NAD-dependent deacylase [Desulfomonilia bacterium]
MELSLIDKTVELLLEAEHAIVLTGAGISTESGVPDFRSPGGIWERYDPTMFFLERFLADPEEVWRCMLDMNRSGEFSLWDARPNLGHQALAYLEEIGIIRTIITQNVDNLHQKAGSKSVIEFHGNMLFARCLTCRKKYGYEQVLSDLETRIPPRCECGGVLKPDAVFFGEAIPQDAMKRSFREAEDCDLMLVIGTSAQVEPAASLPLIAKGISSYFWGVRGIPLPKGKCRVVEINREPTPLTGRVSDFLIQGSAGEILSLIEEKIRRRRDSA